MSLIAILVSLGLERAVSQLRDYRQFSWFDQYTDKIKKWTDERNWQGPVVVLLIMAVPVLTVVVINNLLQSTILGILSLAFSTTVLFFCLGPQDIEQQLERFLNNWDNEDEEEAKNAAKEILNETPPQALSELQQSLVERVLVVASEQILSPIIWFTVFALLGSGPLGVVIYRIACQLQNRFGHQSDAFAKAVNRLHSIVSWVPAHIVALLFAMAGSFVDALHRWRECRKEWQDDWQKTTSLIVVTIGLGALQIPIALTDDDVSSDDIPQHVRAVMGLVLRSILVLVVIIAIITLTLFGN